MSELLRVENLKKYFDTPFGQLHAVDNVSFSLKEGTTLGVVGESGCGKSTLGRAVLQLHEPTSGKIVVNDMNLGRMPRKFVPKYRRMLGVVFQDFRLLKEWNVYENVAFAQRIVEVSTKSIKKNVPAILATVGLAGKYKAKPRQLSGGEQQRVALARALINKPTILLADEPTGNLDPKNSWEIMHLLEEINENGTTVIVVTHSKEIVNEMKKRVITMKKGVVISDEVEGGYIDED